MKRFVLALILAAASALHADEASAQSSADRDVQMLSEVTHFAFDLVALSGRSQGEMALSRILKRDDAVRPLIEVYNRGTTEAKVYVLAAFHHLAPALFEQCRRDLVGKYNPLVRAVSGCLTADGTLLELHPELRHRP